MTELDDFAAIAASDLFDRAWYKTEYPDVAEARLDPLLHYFRFGAAEGRRPNAHFDPPWYRERAGIGPETEALLHYIREGAAAGIPPNPHFDPAWYRAAYGLQPDDCVLADFLARRGTSPRAPSAALYGVRALPQYAEDPPDDPVALHIAAIAQNGAPADCAEQVIATSGLFDLNYYLINGSDVMEAALDAVAHFCAYGWREGRNPNIYFNTKWYMRTNPEVERLGVNPLLHYIVEGEAADRRPVVYFEPRWYRGRYQAPRGRTALAHFLANRRAQTVSPNSLFDLPWYVERTKEVLGKNRDPFAHFLQAGTYADVDPSPSFNAAAYRRSKLGRQTKHFRHKLHPDTDNPLIHFMHATYR